VGLELGLLSLVNTIEELLERKSSSSGLDNRKYGRRDPSRLLHDTPLPAKVGTNFAASGGRSVGIVRSWTQATEYIDLLGLFFKLVSCLPYSAFCRLHGSM
jgi:hypothetical protein